MEGYLPLLVPYTGRRNRKEMGKISTGLPSSGFSLGISQPIRVNSALRLYIESQSAHSLGGGHRIRLQRPGLEAYISNDRERQIVVEGSPAVNLDGIAVEPGQERQLYRVGITEIKGELKMQSQLVLKCAVDQQPSTVPTKNRC